MAVERRNFLASICWVFLTFLCSTESAWQGCLAEDADAGKHWSFLPIERSDLPVVSDSDWVANPIDAFVLNRMESAGITPSPRAPGAKLVRRLHLDLTGLPAEPQAVDRFLADHRADSYERLVDRLIASAHFGERWGQDWLDLARYADSDGYEMDYPRPNAWRWRDWVIAAINRDMPFDQFTIEQLAGDLVAGATRQQRLATGFHRNTLTNTENGIDKEEFRVKSIVDRVNTTGTVWLGLTIECAECHSHKYDPIDQHEYYRLFAFFNDRVDESDLAVPATAKEIEEFHQARDQHRAQIAQVQADLRSAAAEQRDRIKKRLNQLQKSAPELKPVAAVFSARSSPRQTHLHVRGNFLDKGPGASPGVPRVLPGLLGDGRDVDRLELARWLVGQRNPLSARVEANRLWRHLFGVGLVRTPNDFGTQGQPPTHPKLLDWLASELIAQNWSRKGIVRLIVTSETYRQDSARRQRLADVDPNNRLLARQHRFRLDAELVRDQYLAASGLLSRCLGGPSFYPELPAGMAQLGFRVHWRTDPLAEQYRRGIYLVVQRNLAYPMMTTFDRPDSNVSCAVRERSNTPLQSLTQLNDPLVLACARELARRVIQRHNIADRLQFAFRRCLGREPTSEEHWHLASLREKLYNIYSEDLQSAVELTADSSRDMGDSIEWAIWIVIVRTIMNLDEFVTRE